MMKFFDESILIRLRHSLKQLKFGISSIFCLYSFNFEITYNAAKIKQICNWRVVVSGLLFFVQLFIKSFDYTVILITEICPVNYFYISRFCHFVWCCEACVCNFFSFLSAQFELNEKDSKRDIPAPVFYPLQQLTVVPKYIYTSWVRTWGPPQIYFKKHWKKVDSQQVKESSIISMLFKMLEIHCIKNARN